MDTPELSAEARCEAVDLDTGKREKPKSVFAAALWRVGFRRRYVVNFRRQVRSASLVALVAMIPVAMLNLILHLSRVLERESLFASASPDMAQQLAAFDRSETILILLASVVFVVGVFVMALLETHQTSGAAVGVVRHLEMVRDGNYGARLKLRGTDNLKELVGPFNEMASALGDRARVTADCLDTLANQADRLADGAQLADQLRELSSDHAKLAGNRSPG